MASSADDAVGNAGTTASVVAGLSDAYTEMDVPLGRYLSLVLAPAIGLFVATLVLVTLVALPPITAIATVGLGFFAVVGAVLYPKILVERRRTELENSFHLAITHLTVLSTTNIDRMEVFRTLSGQDQYGALAEEVRRIVQLVDTWNQSLDDACRRRGKAVPSKHMSDLLDRLAYSLAAGQDLADFLLSEQQVLVNNYVTIYESSLDNLEVMKDLYLSMILSMTFALVFATVLPVLTGNDPVIVVGAVIVLFILVQSGFYVAVRSVTPHDPVWYHVEDDAPETAGKEVTVGFVGGAVLTLVTCGIAGVDLIPGGPATVSAVYPGPDVPLAIYPAVGVTPLIIPGVILRYKENRIKARDEEFPSFIRALGATESAKQSTTSAVLEDLRHRDFGVLTEDIDNLYKRLNMRIEPSMAWGYFAAETKSYLIQRYAEMYVTGRRLGGDPKELGELISENMNEVLQLREQRRQATITLIGLLYGITAAATFAFYIGLEVVRILTKLSEEMNLDTSGEFSVGQLLNAAVYDIPAIEFQFAMVILFNAMLSALMIRTADGGHKASSYLHFVVLTWLGALVSIVTKVTVSTFLSV